MAKTDKEIDWDDPETMREFDEMLTHQARIEDFKEGRWISQFVNVDELRVKLPAA